MEVKVLALKALKEIIDEKSSFQVVLDRILSEYNLASEDKKFLKNDVLGSIRHFYSLRFEVTTAFPKFAIDDDEIYLMILALHEIRHLSKRIALYEVIESTVVASDYMNLRLEASEIEEKLTYLANNKTPYPEEIKKDPYAYNSLFLSTPLWLVKLWAEQYGDEVAMSLLISSQKRVNQWLAVNTSKVEQSDFDDDERFSLSSLVSTAVLYKIMQSSASIDEVRQGELYLQDLSVQYVMERLDYIFQGRALQLGARGGSITANCALRLQEKNGSVVSLYDDEKLFRHAKYLMSRLGIKNVECLLGELKLMKTYVGYESFDLVILTPPNSRLGQIQKRPDILLTTELEDIKNYVKIQTEYIEEGSKFVSEDGMLVYIVETVDRSEGEAIVLDFLKKNEQFTLLKHKQIFPYEFGSDGVYFAILRRI